VQITIPFIESRMPDELSEAYQQMMRSLPDANPVNRNGMIQTAQSAIIKIRRSMDFLKTYCNNNIFSNQASEISFFKSVKPLFHAQLILWMAIYDIELNRPVGGRKCENKFFKRRMAYLEDFFNRNKDFYHYYRSGQTDRDEIYFLRNANSSFNISDPIIINANPQFASSHDYLVAAILGNELIEKYLRTALLNLKRPDSGITRNPNSSKLQWTASKTGLVELVYALQSGGVFNDGKAKVQEIAEVFQEQFEIKLINYYHTFNELRSRKKNRTAFMQSLSAKLSHKMDELEGS
jgi:RteC protein